MTPIDKEALRWALLRAERSLTQAERAAFDAWHDADIRHKGAYLRAQAIHNALSRATVQENLRPTGNASVLAPQRQAPRWGGRRAFLAFGGMAAGAAWLGLRIGLPQQQPAVLLTTAKGEFRKVPLADHSVANINSASQIEVRLSDRSRDITLLRGEAWFEVAKDKTKPFVVDAGGIRVQAVGTAFGVRRVGKGAEILVTEGVVSVWTDERAGQRSSLAAGEWTFVADQAADITVDRSPDEVARRLAWREGKIIFANQSLKDAVADFNRYSARTIVIADRRLESRTLVGQYQIDAPERFARDVSAFLHVPVSITAQEIRIGRPA